MEPWAFIGPDSIRGQAAELAAAQQNRAFNYAELLYDNQGAENTGWLNDNMVAAAAESIPGLQVHTLLDARSSAAVKAAQKQVDDLATHRQGHRHPHPFRRQERHEGRRGEPGKPDRRTGGRRRDQ